MIATKKHYAFRGRLMSLLVLTHCGVSSRPLLPQIFSVGRAFTRSPQESPCFSSASLLTTYCGSNSNIKTSYNFTSPGEWRAVTPAGTARVRRPRRVVFSRRLRPYPRKASARSDPGRRELHYLAASNPAVTSQSIDFVSKLTILFGGVGNCCPKL